MNDSDKNDRKRTWAELGVPEGMIKEHEELNWKDLGVENLVDEHYRADGSSVMLEEPPQELVERAIEAFTAEEKKRQEARHQERMENSFLYRAYHNAVGYLKRIF